MVIHSTNLNDKKGVYSENYCKRTAAVISISNGSSTNPYFTADQSAQFVSLLYYSAYRARPPGYHLASVRHSKHVLIITRDTGHCIGVANSSIRLDMRRNDIASRCELMPNSCFESKRSGVEEECAVDLAMTFILNVVPEFR